MSGDFIEVSWRSGLGAGSREAESETKKKGGRKPAQEETRRGRACEAGARTGGRKLEGGKRETDRNGSATSTLMVE